MMADSAKLIPGVRSVDKQSNTAQVITYRIDKIYLLIIALFLITLSPGLLFGQWRVPAAVLCYQIEQNFDKVRLPDIPIYKVTPEYKDSTRGFYTAPQDGKNLYHYVNGVHYTYFLAMQNSGTVVYKNSGRFDRFVATVGFEDRANGSARAKVSIMSNDKEIYSSDQISRLSKPLEINVEIPVECKVLKLTTAISRGSGRVIWGNAGFTLRSKAPQVAQCELYVPDECGNNFDVVVVTPTGKQVPSRLCSGYPHRPLKVQFDTINGGLGSYFAYVVPRSGKQSKLDSLWYGQGGLTLETRILDKDKDRCDKHPGFVEAWKNDAWVVDSSITEGIFNSWPITSLDYGHDLFDSRSSHFAQYYYIGYFRVDEAGEYSFATCSKWYSTIFVDDKFVVHWPGRHDFHGGRRCEYSGTINLSPGIHKIEYMNFFRWGELYAMCAWRKGSDVYRIMTGCDFTPQAYYRPVKVFANNAALRKSTFSCDIFDDIRVGINDPAIVAARFEVIPSQALKDPSYRWEFDDGIIALGEKVDHIFIRKGLHKVVLVVNDGDKTISRTEQTVNIDICRDKLFLHARNDAIFNNIISKTYLQHVQIEDLIFFYRFSDSNESAEWINLIAEIIVSKNDKELKFAENLVFYTDFMNYLQSIESSRFDLAANLLERLLNSVAGDSTVITDLRMIYIKLLLDYKGSYQDAARQMKLLPANLDFARQKQREVLRAELQLTGPEAFGELKFSEPLGTPAELERLKVTIAGDLRYAAQCCESNDREVIQHGFDRLANVVNQAPSYTIDAEFNLTRLRLWQAAEAWSQLYFIAKRCERLEMSDIYEPELLGYQILALKNTGKIELANKVFQRLKQSWPYSPETAKAEDLLIQ